MNPLSTMRSTFIFPLLLLFCRARPPVRAPSSQKTSGSSNTAAPLTGRLQINGHVSVADLLKTFFFFTGKR